MGQHISLYNLRGIDWVDDKIEERKSNQKFAIALSIILAMPAVVYSSVAVISLHVFIPQVAVYGFGSTGGILAILTAFCFIWTVKCTQDVRNIYWKNLAQNKKQLQKVLRSSINKYERLIQLQLCSFDPEYQKEKTRMEHHLRFLTELLNKSNDS